MTETLPSLPRITLRDQTGYRLINSKYPPVSLFDDVADEHEFNALHALQALTNPRLIDQGAILNGLKKGEIPFGIAGCSYAVAPFTHVNPDGSRFSDGSFGVLYVADTVETALAEVAYHQEHYWRRVPGLKFERLVLRGLQVNFSTDYARDATVLPADHAVYDPCHYHVSQALGAALKNAECAALRYHSVRRRGAVCWGLFTPAGVTGVRQCAHYEMMWDGQAITSIGKITLTKPAPRARNGRLG